MSELEKLNLGQHICQVCGGVILGIYGNNQYKCFCKDNNFTTDNQN
jgi:hypothetical protein